MATTDRQVDQDTAETATRLPPSAATTRPAEAPVIYFDGVCGLCDRWVDFMLAHDRRGEFLFAPLQGETARAALPEDAGDAPGSVVLVDAAGAHRQSDAVWRMLVRLGGAWGLAGRLLRLVPRPLRNAGYGFVARYRYRWFGRKEACRLPTSAERARFLP